ncbi:MAG: hypothetical protein QOC82_3440 [Frankiaceae bacterium]|nr:hypothetical protein [Frankiaceae bacterium]
MPKSAAFLGTLLAIGVVGCAGSSAGTAPKAPATTPSPNGVNQAPVPAESNPPGDIPDNLAFVPYTNKAGGYRFTHPEGWAEIAHGADVRFTDKLNGVSVSVVPGNQPPTVSSARSSDVARLRQTTPAFRLQQVSSVSLPAGRAVLIVFRRNTNPDPVTGRQYRDEVQEFEFWHHGEIVRLDLFGPVGADNVDAYRTMSRSLSLS